MLNQLFLLVFSVAFHFSGAFREKCNAFHEKHNTFHEKRNAIHEKHSAFHIKFCELLGAHQV